MQRFQQIVTDYFVVWVVLAAGVSLVRPETFLWVLPHVGWMLGVIMFGMGMTLSGADFTRVLRRPRDVLAGAAAQYLVMPLLAIAIARGLDLPDAVAVGVVLLGACPGGTASNVITFLARGDVALSVSMTTVSTLLAPLLTPALVLWLGGHWMQVDAGGLFLSIARIILVPVLLGAGLNRVCGPQVQRVRPVLPAVSVVTILLIVGAVIGRDAEQLRHLALPLAAAVVLHNGGGLLAGWMAGRALGMDAPRCRAVSIEVGMQNSGLAAALALAHFSPEAALPAALFSVWHNVTGPLLASWWRYRDRRHAA